MNKSWRLGSILGFPVQLNASFLLLLAVVLFAFGGIAGVALTLLVFGSVLLHELGHALVARNLGVYIDSIELSFLGGAARMANMPRRSSHEIMIAAAGPAVSLILGGLGLGLGTMLHSSLFAWIGYTNFIIAAFNLIPALPMDGGRILRAALASRMEYVRATDLSVTIARGVAIAFGVIGITTGPFQLLILAPFLWMMGTQERLVARMTTSARRYQRGDVIDV
ncbi:MAG: Zn-dependent protease [Kofleriaceae bacterium]|nr:Zn-dependent protease [Kofleriaceae bacterium]